MIKRRFLKILINLKQYVVLCVCVRERERETERDQRRNRCLYITALSSNNSIFNLPFDFHYVSETLTFSHYIKWHIGTDRLESMSTGVRDIFWAKNSWLLDTFDLVRTLDMHYVPLQCSVNLVSMAVRKPKITPITRPPTLTTKNCNTPITTWNRQYRIHTRIVNTHWPDTQELITGTVELCNRWIRVSCY